jgi:hypothetical protein
MSAIEASILLSISAALGYAVCPNKCEVKIVVTASKRTKAVQIVFETR